MGKSEGEEKAVPEVARSLEEDGLLKVEALEGKRRRCDSHVPSFDGELVVETHYPHGVNGIMGSTPQPSNLGHCLE